MRCFRSAKIKMALLIPGLLLCALSIPASAYTDGQAEVCYTYDKDGKDVLIPEAYRFRESVALQDAGGTAADEPQDLYVDAAGSLYIADTGNDRVLIYDAQLHPVSVIDTIEFSGERSALNRPEGVYVYPDGRLLIADTENERLVICDRQGRASAIVEKPENMVGVTEDGRFLPVKAAADSVGRLYVAARNVNYGFVRLDASGSFLGYVGAPAVQPDLFTLFWRRFSTQKQRDMLGQFVATEYSNIFIEERNFIWGTISTLDSTALESAIASGDTSGNVTPVRRLNSMGQDVLKRNGTHAPLGDLSYTDTPSKIVDVAVSEYGIYSLLDSVKGHIFTYDENGNLLYVFGGIGVRKSGFRAPVSISYAGELLIVLDATLGELKVFEPTEYGALVREAIRAQKEGDIEKNYALWSRVVAQNTNFSYGYRGLGDAVMNQKDYKTAMAYYEQAVLPGDYSRAFVQQRRLTMQRVFPWIMGGILVLIAAACGWSVGRRIVRYCRGSDRK